MMTETSYYDVLDHEGRPLGSPVGPMTEADAIEDSKRHVLRAGELGIVRMARLHLPDEHGRPNATTYLVDQYGIARRED